VVFQGSATAEKRLDGVSWGTSCKHACSGTRPCLSNQKQRNQRNLGTYSVGRDARTVSSALEIQPPEQDLFPKVHLHGGFNGFNVINRNKG